MLPCPVCGHHVRTSPDRTPCPFCDALLPTARATVVATLLGFTLAGCPTNQPLYGVTPTDVATDTGDTADSE